MKMEADILIVGAGPAGLSAALAASSLGAKPIVVDEKSRAGGQLFNQIHKFFGSKEHGAGIRGMDLGQKLFEEATKSGAIVKLETVAWGIFDGNKVAVAGRDTNGIVEARKIIIATGASENPLCFPGWTLPGIMGAGAAQTLVNIHRVLPGQRVLIVGSGNVGLIVAYQLLQAGAEIVAVVEAQQEIGGWGIHASKLVRCGVPVLTGYTIKSASGARCVERATICALDEHQNYIAGSEKDLEVDLICIAVGLSPQIELALMAGCEAAILRELGGRVPIHDNNMETTAPGIYTAGDCAGVEEAHTAMEQGKLAGTAAAESLGLIKAMEASILKADIRMKIDELRRGPFGEKAALAKGEMIKRRARDENR